MRILYTIAPRFNLPRWGKLFYSGFIDKLMLVLLQIQISIVKYFIAYLLTGEPEKAHNCLTKEIERQFGLTRKSPPHVTLKCPFERKSVEDIENVLEKFVKTHSKAQLRFSGFGHFDNEVVYADVIASKEALCLIADLSAELLSLPEMESSQFDFNRKLHCTIADKGNITEIFRNLYGFAALGSFDFNVWLDNVAILKKEKGKWIVFKKYLLK